MVCFHVLGIFMYPFLLLSFSFHFPPLICHAPSWNNGGKAATFILLLFTISLHFWDLAVGFCHLVLLTCFQPMLMKTCLDLLGSGSIVTSLRIPRSWNKVPKLFARTMSSILLFMLPKEVPLVPSTNTLPRSRRSSLSVSLLLPSARLGCLTKARRCQW